MKRFLAAVLMAATASFAHHTPVEPALPPLSELPAGRTGWFSPQPTDQSMYPALHMDSTYAYHSADSLKLWYIALVRVDGQLKAQRVLGWGGWHKEHPDDPHFRVRIRANYRFSETLTRDPYTEKLHWVYLHDTRGGNQGHGGRGSKCYTPGNTDRALYLFTSQTGEGRALPAERIYLGVDWYPYYPDIGFVNKSDVVGVITGHEEEWPWHYGTHNTAAPYNDSEHGCGWTLPPWYRLDDEEHPAPSLDLPPPGPRGQTGTTSGPTLRAVPWLPTLTGYERFP